MRVVCVCVCRGGTLVRCLVMRVVLGWGGVVGGEGGMGAGGVE